MKRDIWVDFNDLDDRGRVVTLASAAEPGVTVSVGTQLIAGDDEGNRAVAKVISREDLWGKPDLLTLQVDLTTFESAPELPRRAVVGLVVALAVRGPGWKPTSGPAAPGR